MTFYRYSDMAESEGLFLPDPDELLMDGVRWGQPYEVPSAAYWAIIAHEKRNDIRYNAARVGSSFLEQVAYCLLGGYGMPAETGIAAYEALALQGLLSPHSTVDDIERALSRPLQIGNRVVHYRFPRQKARYLREAIDALGRQALSTDPRLVREQLRGIPGIGFKTASWIVRDWYGSNDVAIIDIHIERACRAINVFQPHHRVSKNYTEMEERYLAFSRALNVSASNLDNLMWQVMRDEGRTLAPRQGRS